MKQLMISLLLLISVAACAQNFEGTINWSMKMEITDPVTKAKMDEAQKKMNDPATQEKMNEQMKMHEDKMKTDPQYKAMMESNPQMKAQMEKMMAQMQHGNLNSLIPTGFVLKIKNQNTIAKIEGGIMASEFLHLTDGNKTYIIDHPNKTYALTNKTNTQTAKPEVKVTKTGETTKILNYTCTKYNVETAQGGKSLRHLIWATTEIKGIDMQALAKQITDNNNSFFYEGVEGVPMKIEMNTSEGKITMEVNDVKRESLAASLFTIPAGYKEAPSMIPGSKH